jgi:excinuclease ABC subunit A
MELADKLESIDPKKNIIIKGARVHNLKNLDLVIPRNKMIVITGLSGSGKSSLAFDTLYAEGQRRYVESLSSYARQFLGRINKPDVDYIKGISPAVAIEQKVISRNPRSTVGTSTEIYDYLKLLFARIGRTFSPVSGIQVKRDTVEDVIGYLQTLKEETKFLILSPLLRKKDKTIKEQLSLLLQQGFSRVQYKEEVLRLDEFLKTKFSDKEQINIVIDRLSVQKDNEDTINRISDSIQTAFYEGDGECCIEVFPEQPVSSIPKKEKSKNPDPRPDVLNPKPEIRFFSNRFESDGIVFEEPSEHFFSFNNPVGACKTCEGFGSVIGIDEDLVIPDKSLSIYESAVACWKGEKMSEWKNLFIKKAHLFDFPVHKPYYDLNIQQREELWKGNKYFEGLDGFFRYLEKESYKIQYRVMLSRYRGKTSCPECNGTRLRKDAAYVKVAGRSINELVLAPITENIKFFEEIKLNDHDSSVAKRILIEIKNRLKFLDDVGLGYLTLNRLSNTLSGGESQRINLATALGSSLVGSLYILDEPSIGLHSRDTQRLIKVLIALRNIGNTVIVVEHDEEIMRAADQLIDIGPLAGTQGGELIFQGQIGDIETEERSLTARYLTGRETIVLPEYRRKWSSFIEVKGARENNLKNIHVKFPLHVLTVVTGVSGSGKSSLIKRVLYPSLKKIFGGYGEASGQLDRLGGDYKSLSGVEFVDQNPIGKSSRSNPVTYVKAYDEIRALFADQPLSKARGYKPSHFSFNIDGGRCEVCEGDGIVHIEMQFMADIELICEACKGKRFKQETLEVVYRGLTISDVLNLTIDEAILFFESERRIVNKLLPLAEVGLGYVHLGQSSSSLSGGEAQRIKLASFLGMGQNNEGPKLFIFDEPTTGLHFHDIKKLLGAFSALIRQGHTILVIEHNAEVIKCADWVIDLGPEGGEKGGYVLFEGTPEDLVNCKESHTGIYLKMKLLN